MTDAEKIETSIQFGSDMQKAKMKLHEEINRLIFGFQIETGVKVNKATIDMGNESNHTRSIELIITIYKK